MQSQVFSEKLKTTLNAYHNRAISTAQVIEELIALAKELDAATKRGRCEPANTRSHGNTADRPSAPLA